MGRLAGYCRNHVACYCLLAWHIHVPMPCCAWTGLDLNPCSAILLLETRCHHWRRDPPYHHSHPGLYGGSVPWPCCVHDIHGAQQHTGIYGTRKVLPSHKHGAMSCCSCCVQQSKIVSQVLPGNAQMKGCAAGWRDPVCVCEGGESV